MMNHGSQTSYTHSNPTTPHPGIPLSQSNPQLHHQPYGFYPPPQPQRSLFSQTLQQQQHQRMMLMGPRGYPSASATSGTTPNQTQHIPSLLQSNHSRILPPPLHQQTPHNPSFQQPQQQSQLHRQGSNQWGKHNCAVCNDSFNIDLLSMMPCSHR